ncbi:MAG: AarF/UbiB family protein [Candidatus Gastranaerophilales bacterium]|nr:AarF/UbiB family protein [Candidatus Gastranaerophilales bacterium]
MSVNFNSANQYNINSYDIQTNNEYETDMQGENSLFETSSQTGTTVYSSCDVNNLSTNDIELIKKELEREIEESKQELQDSKTTKGWFTNITDSVAGLFGKGDKGKENTITEKEELLESLEDNSENISEVYATITGKSLTNEELSNLQTSDIISAGLNDEEQQAIIAELENEVNEIEENFETAQNSNGWISGSWDKFKNWTGIGASSNKTQTEINNLKTQLEQLKNGETDLAETYKNITGNDLTTDELTSFINGDTTLSDISKAGESLDKYTEGQKMVVDTVADMASGIVAIAATVAAPFTGGTSLLIAAGVGAGLKTAIKASDCIGNEKTYSLTDLGYDTLTGSINGLMGPITNGLGGVTGTALTKACGLRAVESTAKEAAEAALKQAGKEIAGEVLEETVEQSAKQAGKGILSNILAKQGVEYVLKEGTEASIKTSLGKVACYTADMAVDGALSGLTDSITRDVGENIFYDADHSIDEITSDAISGTIGGLIASPIIGGSFRLATNAGSTVLNKINNKITVSNLLPDGSATKFSQGETGDCAFLSVFDGLLGNDTTYKTLKNNIMTNADGSYIVTIGNQAVKVTRESLTDEALSDTTGVRLFEAAYKQMMGTDSLDGGFADVVAEQFGLNSVHIDSDSITDEILERVSGELESGNGILSLGMKVNSDGIVDSDGILQHYFSIKNIDTSSKTINLVDTYDTSKTLTLSFDDVKTSGVSIDGGTIKTTDLPNIERSADDQEFQGIIKAIKNKIGKSENEVSIQDSASAIESDTPVKTKKGLLSKIKDGFSFAKKAYANDEFEGIEELTSKFTPDKTKLQMFLMTDSDYLTYAQNHGTLDLISELSELKNNGAADEEIINAYQQIIESLGTGPTKYAQNLSGNETKMTEILTKFKEAGQIDESEIPLVKEAIRRTKSKCSFTRTDPSISNDVLEEIHNSFDNVNVAKVKRLSAASVGETYLATQDDGTNIVVKMIKQGVTDESLDEEMNMISKFIRATSEDGAEQEVDEMIKKLDNIYNSFHEELNFGLEANANQQLGSALKRSRVASVIAVSDDNRALAMNLAEGIQANKLFPLLQEYSSNSTFRENIISVIDEYKLDPSSFNLNKYTDEMVKEYAELLSKYPQLADPGQLMLDLPKTLTNSFSEQMMFLKNIDGESGAIMHGDPHTGNFFINFDDSNNPIIEYIDTGNVVKSDTSQIVKNLKFFLSYYTGDTREISEYLVDSCASIENSKGLSRTELVNYIKQELDEKVYKFSSITNNNVGQRITNFGEVYQSMQTIIKNLNMTMDSNISNYQKAQGMFLDAITTTNKFTGQSFDMGLLIKDIAPAIKAMKQNGESPMPLVKMVLSQFTKNTEQAVGTIGQFRLNSKEKTAALKSVLKELGK